MLPQRHKYFESRGFNECDIDMFLVGLSANEANDRIRALYEHLRTFGDTTVVRTKCAITFMQEHPHRVIQVILRLYKSPAEILAGFDVDACCVAYNGERVWASQRARRALNGMVNMADPSRQSTTYESRLWKYAVRGFAVAVPGFDAYKVGEHLHECEIGDAAWPSCSCSSASPTSAVPTTRARSPTGAAASLVSRMVWSSRTRS